MTQWYKEVDDKIQNHHGMNEKFSIKCLATPLHFFLTAPRTSFSH